MVNPVITVIMAVYNGELYLRDSIRSILSQSFSDFELIIVDDCSSDKSRLIIDEFHDDRMIKIYLKNNVGPASARNLAIDLAKGKYTAIQDADDISLPVRFEEQIQYLEKNTSTTAVFSFVDLIDVYGAPCGIWTDDRKNVTTESIRRTLPKRNCLANPTALIRTEWLKSIRFPEGFSSSEDYALWLNGLNQGCVFAKIPKALVQYRIHPSSDTAKSNSSPRLKVSTFRKEYLSRRKTAGKFSSVDRKILIYHQLEPLYWFFSGIVLAPATKIFRLIRNNPVKIFQQFLYLSFKLRFYNKKPEIIFFFPYHQIGGAEKVHLSIVKVFSEYRMLILFTKKSDNKGFLEDFRKLADCICLDELPRYPYFGRIIKKRLTDLMNRNRHALIFGSNSKAFYQALIETHKEVCGVDLIHAFVHPQEEGAEHWSIPAVSKLKRRIFISLEALERMKLFYKQHGVSEDLQQQFSLFRNYTDTNETYVVREKNLRAIYIGRGTSEKRIHLLFKIARAVQKYIPSFTLDIVGDVAPNEIKASESYITFHGIIREEEKIRALIRKCHILFLTSYREGLPMVVLEAMSEGCVPVTTAVGDLPSVIEHGKNGFLLPVEDEQTIAIRATEIAELLNSNPSLLEEMGLAAMKTTKEKFSYENFKNAYLSLLNSIDQ
jgi:glycosyltransferase involved in cell wall biosynthesis